MSTPVEATEAAREQSLREELLNQGAARAGGAVDTDQAAQPPAPAPAATAEPTADPTTAPTITTTADPAPDPAPAPAPAVLDTARENVLREALTAKLQQKPQVLEAAREAAPRTVKEEVKRKRGDEVAQETAPVPKKRVEDAATRAAKRAARFAPDLAQTAKENAEKDAEKRKHFAPFEAARARGVVPTGHRYNAHAGEAPYPELIQNAGGLDQFVAYVVRRAGLDVVSFGTGRSAGETTFSIDLKVAMPHSRYGRQNQTIAGSFDASGAVKVFHVGPFG
ncbi:hypothetical protein ACFT8P_33395 [Streptomyces sp. NPDC057101]|uniref:hypothetical protein n=1 Tax=Streptomyces sp. NPDC057101 TaxID=3346020 RepID=UPI003635FCA7